MKQRIFALLLVVALLVTAAVVMVNAAETEKDYNEVYAKAVKMTQDGVFAEANRDAETGAVTADCPYCDAEGATWFPLKDDTATKSLTGNQHYYLPESLSKTEMSTIGKDNTQLTFCLHLNGNNITSTVRVFQIANKTVMNIMGDGVVTGGYTDSKARLQYGATLDSTGWLNLCGGTYKRTSSQAVIGLRGTSGKVVDYGNGMAMYDGTVIDGGGESYTASTVYVHGYGSTNTNRLIVAGGTIMNGNNNIYAIHAMAKVIVEGGTITGGNADIGGNIYMSAGTMEITGGKIVDGGVYGNPTVSGNPVIEAFQADENSKLTVGTLENGASIGVGDSAAGAVTTAFENVDAATAALPYIHANHRNLSVDEAAKTINVSEIVCPHCGKTESELAEMEDSWQAWTGDTLTESGHYYLAEDNIRTSQVATGPKGLESAEGAKEIIVDLRGKDITSTSRGFWVYPYNTLYLMDTVGTSEVKATGFKNSNKGDNGGVIHVAANAKLNVASGKYTLNSNVIKNGGVIYAATDTDVTVGNATLDGSMYDQESYNGSVIFTQGQLTLDGFQTTSHPAGNIPFAIYIDSKSGSYNGRVILKGNTVINNNGIGGNLMVSPYARMTVDASFSGDVKVSLGGNHVPDPYYGKALMYDYDTCTGAFTGKLILDDWLENKHNYGAPAIQHKYDATAETPDTDLYIQGDVIILGEIADRTNVKLYTSVEDMLKDYVVGTHFIRLGGDDMEIDLPEGEHIIDINGYPVKVTCSAGEATVSGFDSSNAMNLTSKNGALTVGETVTVTDELKHAALDGKEYYMLNKQGTNTYTYHYVTLKLASVSLRTREVGIYYTAEIKADSRFRDAVAEYGIVVRLDEAPTENFATEDLTGWSIYEGPAVSGTVYGTMVSGIMKDVEGRDAEQNKTNGERPIYAAAYITLASEYGGETAISGTANYSLKSFMDALDANTKLLATKITNSQGEVVCTYEDKLDEFYTAWKDKGMHDWSFTNINVVEEAEPEA